MLDGQPVGAGRVGPITRQLMTLFEAYFTESALTADTGAAGEPGLRTLG